MLNTDKHPNRGKRLYKEWRQKISDSQIGKKLSEETKRKISITKKENKLIGKDNHLSKKFVITQPDGVEFYVIGLTNFCRNFKTEKVDHRLLHAVANGKRNHHKGYKCRYYDEVIDKNIKYYDGGS